MSIAMACAVALLRSGQSSDAAVGFGVAGGIDVVRLHVLVHLDRLRAVVEVLVVNASGSQTGVVRRLLIPLIAAMVVLHRPVIHAIGLALVDVAQPERDRT